VLAVAALSFGAGGIVFSQDIHPGDHSVPTYSLTQLPAEGLRTVAAVARSATPPRLLEQGSPFSFADLVEHVSPAVVTVVVDRESAGQQMTGLDDVPAPFRDFFRQFGQGQGQGDNPRGQGQGRNRQPQTFKSQAMGSAFIIDPTGYIVTNNHVIEEGKKISVKLPSGREFQAHLVGADKDTDVALIKVDGVKDLPIVAFGDDRRLRLSDEAPMGGLRPRADLTILDAAKVYGPSLLLVVLTGMGKDGLDGARAVKKAGGRVLVEAESTCVVYGMPRAVAEAGLADEILPLDELPAAIAREAS